MKSPKVKGVLLSTVTLAATAVAATPGPLITFDDLTGPPLLQIPVPDGYCGLEWGNFYFLNATSHPLSGYHAGMVSPRNVAYNAYADPALFSGVPFDFNYAYLTAAWNDNLQVDVVGSLGGLTKYSQTITLSATAPTLVNFNFLDIDRVDFSSYGGTEHPGYSGRGEQFAIDNIGLNVPEPYPGPAVFAVIGFAFAISRRSRQT